MYRKHNEKRIVIQRADKCFNCKWTTGNRCPLLSAMVWNVVDLLYDEYIVDFCAMQDPIMTEVVK